VLHVEVSTTVKAPRQTVLEVYADSASWPRMFPTISAVRLLRREGAKLVLEVDHEVDHVEGKVVNELVVRPPDALDLWEEKRRYDARFLNRFETVPGGDAVHGARRHLPQGLGQAPAAVPARLRARAAAAVAVAAGAGRGGGTRPAGRRGSHGQPGG